MLILTTPTDYIDCDTTTEKYLQLITKIDGNNNGKKKSISPLSILFVTGAIVVSLGLFRFYKKI